MLTERIISATRRGLGTTRILSFLLSIYKTEKALKIFKEAKNINSVNNTHKKCHQERSWEPPRCPNSIANPKQKTKIKKSRKYFENVKIKEPCNRAR